MELGESEFVRQGKHDLTPTSKMAAMPQAKRFEVGGRPSGQEVKERREKLEMVLKDGFELKEGSEISVESVLSYAGLDDDSQTLVSRAIKDIFPGVTIRREDKKGIKQYPLY
ncbi:hypothetical protein OS493_012252 [Desmophyllum pertusum]|uniref:Uncharacterized protein n=1 Tax=Desmophyllum pertusum TaxID=174260 RepID=A0A9W9ZRP6_9CNID|nr:hypothetical protein OS493_012252 [Desmophyllum pertusum]